MRTVETANLMLRRFIVTVLLFLSPYSVYPIDFYDVEIVIFEQLNPIFDSEDLTTQDNRKLDLEFRLKELHGRPQNISIEPTVEGYLDKPSRRITDSFRYQILFYGGWSQKTSDRKSAPYVDVNLPKVGQNTSLKGVLRLFSTDLLYVDILLRYGALASNQSNEQEDVLRKNLDNYFFIDERRRIKIRETHFFDHPRFGILLTVWPVRLP